MVEERNDLERPSMFVALRIDYCNAVLAGAPKATTNKLQRALNAAARVVSGTHKFNRGLSQLLHTEVHWLDVPGSRVQTRRHGVQLCGIVSNSRRCHITATSSIRGTTRQLLVVPRHQLSSYGFLCGWSVSLEFPARQLAEYNYWRE